MAEEAAEIMSSRGESDAVAAHRAYLLLDAELAGAAQEPPPPPTTTPSSKISPSPVSELRRPTAEALLSWIRSSTAGNGLVVDDGGQVATADTEERRKLWAEHAPRVLQLVKDIGEEPSSDPEVCCPAGPPYGALGSCFMRLSFLCYSTRLTSTYVVLEEFLVLRLSFLCEKKYKTLCFVGSNLAV